MDSQCLRKFPPWISQRGSGILGWRGDNPAAAQSCGGSAAAKYPRNFTVAYKRERARHPAQRRNRAQYGSQGRRRREGRHPYPGEKDCVRRAERGRTEIGHSGERSWHDSYAGIH